MRTTDSRRLTHAERSSVIAFVVILETMTRLYAQTPAGVENPGAVEVACSMITPSGSQSCGAPTAVASCHAEADFASQPSDESTAIVFNNRSEQAVSIWWLNFKGQRVLYDADLAPGVRFAQQTFVGHHWMVTTAAGQCLAIYTAEPAEGAAPATAASAVGTTTAVPSVAVMPPALPNEEPLPPPEDNLIWTPGYWAWNAGVGDYYWVAGAWVGAPIVGYLWTPGYWALEQGRYGWHAGYWGPHVGFYGGINYGYGYFGRGFVGGRWRDGQMYYNTGVMNAGSRSSHVYNDPAGAAPGASRTSFNGEGGVRAQPSVEERVAAADYHLPATSTQLAAMRAAQSNPAMSAGLNNGHPPAVGSPDGSGAPGHHAGTLSVTHFSPPAAASGGPAGGAPARAPTTRNGSQPRPASGIPQRSTGSADAAARPTEAIQRHKAAAQLRTRPVPHAEAR